MNAPNVVASPAAEDVLLGFKRLLGDAELVDEQRSGVIKLLQLMALPMPAPRLCPAPGCGKCLWFFRTRQKRLMPIDDTGKSHFANCTEPERFRKPKEPT